MEENTLEKETAKETVSKNFIEQIIDKDLEEGKYEEICTRFPPGLTAICISDMPSLFY